jgi:integrase
LRTLNKLTALAVTRATKRGMFGDGGGLYLQVAKGGSKSWILRFKVAGRTRHLGLGSTHTVGLAEARQRAAEARLALLDGKDPIEARRALRAAAAKAMTFDQGAAEFIAAHAPGWGADHRDHWRQTIADYASPAIGATDLKAIGTEDILRVLTPIWTTKVETASRLRGRIENILDWAKVKGLREGENPARWRGHLDHLLPKKKKVHRVKHRPAIAYSEIAEFMKGLRERESVRSAALQFQVLTAVRPGEARGARWPEIDIDRKLWTIPAGRMKARAEHRVPLSAPAIAVLEKMAGIRVSEWVFPGLPGRPVGELAMFTMLREMGRGDVTAHGMRSAFRDWCGNETSFARELAEQALAHAVGDSAEQAYRRSDALERRRALMDTWARYCQPSDECGKVISLGSR